MERRQARIRRIRQKLDHNESSHNTQEVFVREKGPVSSELKHTYHIGMTQNHPLDLNVLNQQSCHDPAAKVVFCSWLILVSDNLTIFFWFQLSTNYRIL